MTVAKRLTDAEWKKRLTPKQYKILREKGTEVPFSGKFLNHKANGMYSCLACGAELFDSKTKFDSGSGWPSFYDVARSDSVKLTDDLSGGMKRIEISCASCGSHLGHVFNDAPQTPTGKRFCINSCALDFNPKAK
ncbi:peptide-methionine (R)-S-oxide reductase [Candidatus Saccharibacteria bacterium RIFCSPHIGHO2_01_FULL_48_12]|nr:MAG: peptide-methionine (R)-S-oxide reductase [Candidatus Saccharibacteria bacterium RIFCSPHIGHO2_01_FULL_48_12]